MDSMFKSSTSPKTLYPHQARAIEMLRDSIRRGNRRIVVAASTGFGKTLVAAKIIEGAIDKGNSAMFTAPAISLINQTIESFENEGVNDIGVMQASHPRTDPHAKIQICSLDTLARREHIPSASIYLIDEMHRHSAVVVRLMEDNPNAIFVGLSATPWSKGLGLIWEDLVIPITIGELIEQGYLSEFKVFAPDVPDLSGVRSRGGDYAEDQVSEVMGGNAIMGNVVQNWLANGENRPTLAFGTNCDHAKAMANSFEAAGVAVAYIDARVDTVEREIIERKFETGEIKVVCSVRTMTTGIDWPVSGIIDAAPTRSKALHIQKLGRGLRINEGTEDLVVWDHAGNCLRLGLPTDISQDELDTTPRGERMPAEASGPLPKPCRECDALFTGLVCPSCGYERVLTPKEIEHAEGGLVQISGKKAPAPTRDQKQDFYSGLIAIAEARPTVTKKEGWVAHKYKAKFDVWPRGMAWRASGPSREVSNFVTSQNIAFAKRREATQ